MKENYFRKIYRTVGLGAGLLGLIVPSYAQAPPILELNPVVDIPAINQGMYPVVRELIGVGSQTVAYMQDYDVNEDGLPDYRILRMTQLVFARDPVSVVFSL